MKRSNNRLLATMADAISAEEQRQIDAAIALSLGQEPASGPPTIPATSRNPQAARQIINIDDSSDGEEVQSSEDAHPAVRTSAPISFVKDNHDDESASADTSATELSEDETSAVKTSLHSKKRKNSLQTEDDDTKKKPKHEIPSSSKASRR